MSLGASPRAVGLPIQLGCDLLIVGTLPAAIPINMYPVQHTHIVYYFANDSPTTVVCL